MITREDAVLWHHCFICKSKIEGNQTAFELRKGTLNPAGVLLVGYWRKDIQGIVDGNVYFHEHCFLDVAGAEYDFASNEKCRFRINE